ncbi:MAG: hypothetical protein AB2L07_14245 [Thermoanaerobaculaceae bacterium]
MNTATCVELAGLRFRIITLDPAWHSAVRAHWGAFLGTGAEEAEWQVALTRPLEPSSQAWTPTDKPWSCPAVSLDDGVLALNAPGIDATVDIARREAQVATGLGRALEAFLRILLPLALTDGTVFHSAMLMREGAAILCVGESGAGKSTLAGLVPDLACADEHAAVRLLDDEPTAFALPFWHSRPRQGRLVAICLLGHGSAHSLETIPREVVFRALVPQVLWPVAAADKSRQAFIALATLAGRVPAYSLRFRVDTSVRDVLPFE